MMSISNDPKSIFFNKKTQFLFKYLKNIFLYDSTYVIKAYKKMPRHSRGIFFNSFGLDSQRQACSSLQRSPYFAFLQAFLAGAFLQALQADLQNFT